MDITNRDGEVTGTIPPCDVRDHASVEAWHGAFGFFTDVRKIVLSNCYEAERAKALGETPKPTESALENRARTCPAYVEFITQHLDARIARERNVLTSQQTR